MIIFSSPILEIDETIPLCGISDYHELRLDYLQKPIQFPLCKIKKNYIITIRDCAEGGKNQCCLLEKIAYYQLVISKSNCLVDLELANYSADVPAGNLILSYHDFSDQYDLHELESKVLSANQLPAKYLKIAVNITKYNQFHELANIIKLSNKPVILVGMGKLGKISRLLYSHIGSVATYIAKSDKATVPGQLTTDEAELMKLNRITPATQIGGLIGGNQVYHSLGLAYFNSYFAKNDLPAAYLPFQIDDLEDFWRWINSSQISFYGFSITMPHKSSLTERLGIRSKLKAYNLFLPKNHKLYNTDMLAFGSAVDHLHISNNENILIMGTGNTTETALFALQDFPNVIVCGRNEIAGNRLAEIYQRQFVNFSAELPDVSLLINCTSLGLNGEDFWAETGLCKYSKTFSSIKVIDLPYSQKISSLITHCNENDFSYTDGKMFWQWQSERQLLEFCQAITQKEKK